VLRSYALHARGRDRGSDPQLMDAVVGRDDCNLFAHAADGPEPLAVDASTQ
jgi:hypothetical protein